MSYLLQIIHQGHPVRTMRGLSYSAALQAAIIYLQTAVDGDIQIRIKASNGTPIETEEKA